MIGPTMIQAAPIATAIGWILLGLVMRFEDERARQEWLWSGLSFGVIYLVMYVFYNAPGLR